MTDPWALSKHVDHIPVIWVEPENLSGPARLVIWLGRQILAHCFFWPLPCIFSIMSIMFMHMDM